MGIAWWAPNAAAVVTLLLGALGLFAPGRAAAFTRIAPLGLDGRSEIRATYGGLFAAMGLWCLISQSMVVFVTVGVAWLGAAIGRGFSVAIDRNPSPWNLAGVAFEALLGLLLLAAAQTGGSVPG
jgi:hypothetical protein